MTTDETTIRRYPLDWPTGWRRRQPQQRQARAHFSMTRGDGETKRSTVVNMATAMDRLERQLDLLGARNVTLSTNVSLSIRGVPRGDENPADPGAAVYFGFRGKATVLACDTYVRVADNIAALAGHIEALRRIERYGVGTIEQALAGYKALPADTAANWRAVFGFAKESSPSRADVETAYRREAKRRHPDVGGSEIEMAHINRARDYALDEIGAQI